MKARFTKKLYGAVAMMSLLLIAFRGNAQSGKALNFTQSNSQYVTVPHSASINLGANFTMEAIVNYTGFNSTIVDKGNYDFLWQLNANNNNGKMGFYLAATNTWVYSTGSVPQGVSTHVAIVCNGGSITFYINGGAAGGGSGSARQDNLAMTIGRQQPSSGGCQCNHMNGTIDEFRIWNLARTQSQISNGINLGVPSNSSGLVALYNFDEGSGSTTADASGNGNNGTLVNGPGWVAAYARPASYTYTVPAGVHSIRVQLWGGGAAGGTCNGPSGGGGVFVQSKSLPVTAGQVYTIVPGSGGYLVNQSGGESYISLNGNKIIGALGGTPKIGQENVFGVANVEYSFKGGDAGTNDQYSDGSGTHILYGGGGASGGTTGAGGNGVNANNTDGVGAGGQPVGTGGAGGSGGHQINCEQQVSPFAGVGANPGGGGGAPFNDYLRGGGGHGRIIIKECYSPGTITGHTRPFPYELITDSVFNENIGSTLSAPYTWEQSTNNSTWTTAPGGITTRSYPIQVANPPEVMYYRRKEASCGLVSNTATIKTYSIANTQLKGKIEGKVVSINNTGVDGIPVEAQKTVSLLGSPITKIYYDTTKNGGKFSFKNVFYGDASNPTTGADPGTVRFMVKAVYAGHRFSPPVPADLAGTGSDFEVNDLQITDSTVYAISGLVTQTCNTCDVVVTDGTDSIKISAVRGANPVGFSFTGDNGRGGYGLTFTDPGAYVLTPSYRNHTFTPAVRTVNVINGDVTGASFSDNTTRTISGTLRAGNNQVIGSAQIVFTDTFPGRASVFTKTVNTAADGSYSVTLPARKYKVRVNTFTPAGAGSDITALELTTFFNQSVKDSMLVDIDTLPRIFNLIYHRAPVLQIVNLLDTTCGTADYVVFRQNKPKTFIINVFEGNPSYGFKVATDSVKRIRIITDVHVGDIADTIRRAQRNGADTISLPGGEPNIIAPFQKIFKLNYTDKYGRAATEITRNVVVLGIKNAPGTFVTVSPEIPLMILHDPPGDQSTSFWETNKTNETAMRFYTAKTQVDGGFVEAKLGTRFMLGFGYTSEVSIWGTLNFSQQVTARVNDATEAIITTTNTERYESSNSSYIIGDGGDVYIGAALNLKYAVGREVKYISPCVLGRDDKLAIAADSGFATRYAYTESHITRNIIPTLQYFVANSTDSAQRLRARNQISVWQQVVANNAANKAKAKFVENRSFNGATAPLPRYTTTTSTNSNTIEFSMEIDRGVAIGLGLEIAGIGVSGGFNVNMKVETGKSITTTSTETTIMGYVLDDKDDEDYFSVDVKKDPVYNSPVFTLVAGATSCPPEPPGQNRDGARLRIPNPVQSNLPANGQAVYYLYLGNASESGENRGYKLRMLPTGQNGAIVKIGAAPATDIFDFPNINFGEEEMVVVTVEKGAGNFYNYQLQFVMESACSGGSTSVGTITANFASPCSGVTLAAPGNNFVLSSTGGNAVPVQMAGYTVANLQSIALQHTTAGGNAFVTDTTILQGNITNPNSTTLNWQTNNLPDGAYDLRLLLNCIGGTVYSQRVTGIVDRTPPLIFGRPEPMDDNYVAGDIISATFTEFINTNNLNSGQVKLRKRSDGSLIPIQVTGFQNKIVVTPVSPITSLVGENIQLIVNSITDMYGNVQVAADTSLFVVGTTVVGTGPNTVNLTVTRPSVRENAIDSLDFRFNIQTASNDDRLINYTIGGTATFGTDYTVSYPAGQPLTTSFNGIQGKIYILKFQTQAILRIKAIGDNTLEPDETITISLAEGDYVLGSGITKTDTIRNDDHSKPIVIRNGPLNICAGQTLTLSTNNTIDGLPVLSYQWTNGAATYGTTQTISVTQPGTYRLTVFTGNNFTGVSDSLVVTVSGLPAPSLGADVTVYKDCFGETTNLNTLFTTTGLTINWNTANTIAAPPGMYRLVASNSAGCTDTAFANVILEIATWTGAISNDWNTAGNWNINKVPGPLTHVIIATNMPNPCIINTTDAVAASIQIRNGATLRAITNQALKVNGKCLTLPPN